MSDPKRLLDEDGPGADLLRAGLSLEPPEEAKARVWAAVVAVVGPPGGGGPAGGEGSGPAGAAGAGGGAGGVTVGTSAFVQAIKWALAGAAGATVVLGAAVALEPMRPAPAISATTPQPPPPHPSALAPEPPTRALVDPPAPSAASSARTFPVAPVVSPSSRGRSEPTEPLPEPAPAPSPSSAKSLLLEENRFLTAARRALQNGDATGALQTIDASRTRFPRAILAQERDALEALALAHGGRQAEARAKAATFLERYPTSPHAQQMIELGR